MSERASESIAEDLRRMIITGELAPGTVVSEGHLSDLLACGRTPLREALRQLNHEYLVDIPPRRGILIPQLGIFDFQQNHEGKRLADSAWIELATERISEQQVEQMKDIVAQQERANEAGQFYELTELDCRFHILLAEATGNRYFVGFASRLYGSGARFVYRAFEAAAGGSLSIAEHRQIVEALEKRDADLAALRVREHSTKSSERALNILGGFGTVARTVDDHG